MKLLRALVVDDEPAARQALRSLLEHVADLRVIGECASGAEAVESVHRLRPDLLFLDVEMPDGNGFDVLQQLAPGHLPAVVFVTAFDHYAADAFRVDAIDYMLKPFDAERLAETVSRVRRRLARGGPTPSEWADALRALADRGRSLERVAVLDGDASIVIKTSQIRWLESQANYLRLHVGDRSYLARGTMRSMEQRLDATRFVRIHRTAIVNLDHVRQLRPIGHGDLQLVLADGTELSVSRRYRSGLERLVERLA
ncbi:MAG TPA: LytTR family transcriptional regulator DNA-binding domain-containing protein [Candidatus Polarisedimenticolaceae bacterium]|nr:LytTR family transcriptional regulator DNA-binding domain-containing protein [Candidatus Polarisedimenticolaceae bacterium]